MTKMTVNGISTTTGLGQEQYEKFKSAASRGKKTFFSYDYRHTDGELFACVKPTLDMCRAARDAWLAKKIAVPA